MRARIFVADDHDIVREGVKSLLLARPDWIICGEANNGKDAVSGVRETCPDIAVLDISMPVLTGLEAAKQISQTHPEVRILIFTMHDSKSLIKATQQAGALGLVLKSFAARDLVRAIESLLAGGSFFESDGMKEPKSKPPGLKSIFLFCMAQSGAS